MGNYFKMEILENGRSATSDEQTLEIGSKAEIKNLIKLKGNTLFPLFRSGTKQSVLSLRSELACLFSTPQPSALTRVNTRAAHSAGVN